MQIYYMPTMCKLLFQGAKGTAINTIGKTNHCPYYKAKYIAY